MARCVLKEIWQKTVVSCHNEKYDTTTRNVPSSEYFIRQRDDRVPNKYVHGRPNNQYKPFKNEHWDA